MRKLTCKSTDNYQYEGESLEFIYNSKTIFRQSNRSLNRGGKTLVLYDCIAEEEIVSSGICLRGEKWWRKISKYLKELNYEISWEDIKKACEDKHKENRQKKLSDTNFSQRDLKRELEKAEKRVIHLRKQIRENKILINSLTDKTI